MGNAWGGHVGLALAALYAGMTFANLRLYLPPPEATGEALRGPVGLALAARHPHRCRTPTVVAAPPTPLPAAQRRRIGLLVAAYGLVGAGPLCSPVVESLLSPATRAGDQAAVDLVCGAFTAARRGGMRLVIQTMMLQRPDLTALLGRIAAPTLFVAGADWAAQRP